MALRANAGLRGGPWSLWGEGARAPGGPFCGPAAADGPSGTRGEGRFQGTWWRRRRFGRQDGPSHHCHVQFVWRRVASTTSAAAAAVSLTRSAKGNQANVRGYKGALGHVATTTARRCRVVGEDGLGGRRRRRDRTGDRRASTGGIHVLRKGTSSHAKDHIRLQ